MKDWPPKFRLITILATTIFLLSRSDSDGWGFEKPKDIKTKIHQMLCFILGDHGAQLPEHYNILYAPTGPLQEISIANGWSEVYLKLAEEFDNLEYLLKEKQNENA